MNKNNDYVSIPLEKIYQHPNNPRKNIGDISELTESIRKKGILQNLIVIEGHATEDGSWSADDYTVIIGHRRRAAAIQAGLTEVPCKIMSGTDLKDQVGTMMEENMQRNDLNIQEQAQGFQMMLDLGETEQSISEKTGFSKSTIHHRLQIAKLDQKEISRRIQKPDYYQPSIMDYMELEKIQDIDDRNEILRKSTDSENLKYLVRSRLQDLKRQETINKLINIATAAGIKPAPEKLNPYSEGVKIIQSVQTWNNDIPEAIKTPQYKKGGLYYKQQYSSFLILHADLDDKGKRIKTKKELLQAQQRKNGKKLIAIEQEMREKRKSFIQGILNGTYKTSEKNIGKFYGKLWIAILAGNNFSAQDIYNYVPHDKVWWQLSNEERSAETTKIHEMNFMHQLLLSADIALEKLNITVVESSCIYQKEIANTFIHLYEVLKLYGMSLEGEEEQVLYGTHPFYQKERK